MNPDLLQPVGQTRPALMVPSEDHPTLGPLGPQAICGAAPSPPREGRLPAWVAMVQRPADRNVWVTGESQLGFAPLSFL